MGNVCARRLQHRLAAAPAWLTRSALGRDLPLAPELVDDALAALVAAGDVVVNPRSGEFKLAGPLLARRALRTLIETGAPRHLQGAFAGDVYRVGIAVRCAGPGGDEHFVMAELEMPAPAADELPRFMHGWMQFGAALQRMPA